MYCLLICAIPPGSATSNDPACEEQMLCELRRLEDRHLTGSISYPYSLLNLGKIYYGKKDFAEAKVYFDRALASAKSADIPEESVAEAMDTVAAFSITQGDKTLAERMFNESIAIRNAGIAACYGKSTLAVRNAASMYQYYSESTLGIAEPLRSYGVFLMEANRADEAENIWKTEMAFLKNKLVHKRALAAFIAEYSKYEELVGHAKLARQLKEESATIYEDTRTKERKALEARLAIMLQSDPVKETAWAARDVAAMYSWNHRFDDAVKFQRKYVELCRVVKYVEPELPGAYETLGNYLQADRQIDQAKIAYRKAVQLYSKKAKENQDVIDSIKNELVQIDKEEIKAAPSSVVAGQRPTSLRLAEEKLKQFFSTSLGLQCGNDFEVHVRRCWHIDEWTAGNK